MNYTRATELLEENEIEHHLSPRYEICPVDFTDANGNDLAPSNSMCLKFIDTEQEKEIGVGVTWPYEKLQLGECLISSDFERYGVSVGDKVHASVSWIAFWNLIAV